MSPQLKQELMSVLAKLIGETVKDKLVRALLVGILSSVGDFTDNSTEPVVVDPPPAVILPSNKNAPE